ncbi:MAG: acyltransferase family protein [Bacteroidia bacterium]
MSFLLSRSYFKSNKIETLVSSAIRRFLRLYIPVAFTLVVAFILLRASIFYFNETASFTHSWWLTYVWPKDSSIKVFIPCFFYGAMFLGDNTYDTTMWTMAPELFGSMMVFAILALTYNSRARWVVLLVIFIIIFQLYNKYYLAFIIGISLNYLDKTGLEKIKFKKILVPLMVIAGLILGGFPSGLKNYDHQTFYRFSSFPGLINKHIPIHILGATLIIIAVLISTGLQKFFSGKLFVFLGDISFSAYLIHPLIIETVSCLLFLHIYNGSGHYNISAVITFLITIAVVIILSKIVTVLVDKPGVRFSKYVYTRFFKAKEQIA